MTIKRLLIHYIDLCTSNLPVNQTILHIAQQAGLPIRSDLSVSTYEEMHNELLRAIQETGGSNVLVSDRVDLAGFVITWEIEDGR